VSLLPSVQRAILTAVLRRAGPRVKPNKLMPLHPQRTANPTARCPKVKDRQLRAMVEAAWAAGWWCEKTAEGHAKCYSPAGPGGQRGKIVFVANTPSDHRTIPNTRSTFRRAGLQL
jgi:hypothetical protein